MRSGLATLLLTTLLAAYPVAAQDAKSSPIAEAKAALTAGDVAKAVTMLEPLATSTSAPFRQDAIELLGLAYERQGQFSKARAQYELYLKNYPNAVAAPRVKERLEGVITAQEAASQNQKWTSVDDGSKAKKPSATLTNQPAPAKPRLDSTLKSRLNLPERKVDPEIWTWEKSGGLSQFYYHNETLSPDAGTTASDVITSGDINFEGENGYYRFAARASGYNLTSFLEDRDDIAASVSTFYADLADKSTGSSVRLGRQSRNDAGIFGRFDGVDINLNSSPRLSIGVAAGSPVYSRDSLPFDEGRYFVSANASYKPEGIPLRGSIYAIEQRVKSVVDRRAIGAEVIYEKDNIDASAHSDFDVFYGKLNSAGAAVAWQPSDVLSLYATLDYQTVPFLLTSNALLGQSTDTLPSLVNILGTNEVTGLAEDRTADAVIATFGMAYDLNDTWQASIDAFVADYGGTKASGGVGAEPNQRPDIYVAATLTGVDVLREGDQISWGVRFSDTASSALYTGEVSMRFPVNDKMRFNTRLRVSAKDTKDSDPLHWIIMPDFGIRYRVNKHWNLESDAGLRWESQPGADQFDLQAAIGYRYEF